MNETSKFTSQVVVLLVDNIDTDQIIPARFLKATDKNGMGDHLFADWRYNPDGSPKTAFPLNSPSAHTTQVLLAGDNFGCGSSREHAPWALTGFGFRAVISTSFADIFRNNALKNNLLPLQVDADTHQKLAQILASDPSAQVTVDLANETLELPDGSGVKFPIDPFARTCLLNGVDELGYILGFISKIEAYEQKQQADPFAIIIS